MSKNSIWPWISLWIAVLVEFHSSDGVKRGPHHPRSEQSIHKKHLTHEEHRIEDDLHDMGININLDEMTEDEKHFYYFKIHDNDKNNALDGLEMLQAALHQDDSFYKMDRATYLKTAASELYHIVEVIDEFLLIADSNKDGLLHYPEYMKAVSEGKEVEQKIEQLPN